MNTAEHLERHLGPIERGWSAASLSGIQVCLFRDRPAPGVTTLATLGLSNTVLPVSSNRKVRQELLLASYDERPSQNLVKALMHGVETVLAREHALLRGDIVPLGGPITAGSAATGLYASIPVVFYAGLATLQDSVPATVVVWLIPVLPAEIDFVESSGWSEFEERLEAADPDLLDLTRSSVL